MLHVYHSRLSLSVTATAGVGTGEVARQGCAAGGGRTVGQGAQDAQELQARVLLAELLQRTVARPAVVQPLLTWPCHQHLPLRSFISLLPFLMDLIPWMADSMEKYSNSKGLHWYMRA